MIDEMRSCCKPYLKDLWLTLNFQEDRLFGTGVNTNTSLVV
jgi:hypothetical protein